MTAWFPRLPVAFVLAAALASAIVTAQGQTVPQKEPTVKRSALLKLAAPWPDAEALRELRLAAEARPLFAADDPLTMTLTSSFREVNKDRNPESTRRHKATLTVAGAGGQPASIPVELRARGHFRRMGRNCDFVPLWMDLPKDGLEGTPFDGQRSVKLGTHCRDVDAYEQYVLREYLAYRVFNLITPQSFRVRLARATYVDEKSGKRLATRYAILSEHESDVARRLEGRGFDLPHVTFREIDPESLTTMMLFEFMIGNTDFSIYALHNVKLVQTRTRTLYSVPYDFDLSGLVHAVYATPSRNLGILTVLDRLYRGPCRTAEEFDALLARFRARRAEVLAIPSTIPGLQADQAREARNFLDDFYAIIDKPASVKQMIVGKCLKEAM